jgi:hypothetical protein
MKDPVATYLEKNGPSLSSDVAEFLVTKVGLTPATARKRISRAEGDIKKLGYITFPRKARFVYLQRDFGSPIYWSKLTDALLKTNSAYGYAIAALRLRDGFIPSSLFPIVCGAPVRQLKHLSADTIFTRLSEAGLLNRVQVAGMGECIALVQSPGYYDNMAPNARARMLTEELLLAAIRDWVRNLGIVSYDKVSLRGPDALPRVGTFAWDLTAPSYLGFMVKRHGEGTTKPGFFVCDVFLDQATESGVQPFIKKCETLRQLRNVGPCMQMFVATRFSGKAHQLLKKHGIIAATPGSLFGEDVASGLNQLSSILKKSAFMSVDPAEFDELFKKFSKLESALLHVRGTLFEYLTAEIARRVIAPHVRLNQFFRAPDGGDAEADVVAIRDDQSVTFIECKGYSPYAEVPHSEVERWLQVRVPRIRQAALHHPDWRKLTLRFELWTTGLLSQESLDFFAKAKERIKPTRYVIEVLLGDDILKKCREAGDPSITLAFRKHFTKGGRRAPIEIETFVETEETA